MSYTILGRKIASEYLALGTYATVGGISYWAMSGEKKSPVEAATANVDQSEADFIKDFVAQMEKEEASAPSKPAH